jgi:hypothetical protein
MCQPSRQRTRRVAAISVPVWRRYRGIKLLFAINPPGDARTAKGTACASAAAVVTYWLLQQIADEGSRSSNHEPLSPIVDHDIRRLQNVRRPDALNRTGGPTIILARSKN